MEYPPANSQEHLVALITRHQGALRGYIQSLMPVDDRLVDDVLQETNLILWRKAEEYDAARPFMPWACRIAFFQVKSARRDVARDRHVFDSELVDQLAAEEFDDDEATGALDHALQECLGQLPPEKRALILERYHPEASVGGLAAARGQTPNAISLELHRIRHLLEVCVERKLVHSLP
ncbi:sigma-70 family RNA polymerase sigma factor [Luteolibacter ambystomatis]|uniref:Sigma-70 family RNA polymerase sigma factor n=1 Tax=Luteolibacter ambystomatis TaxID=2824561 RepID=A0A975IY40_9BACT|nr:sigma-70 family RNA polymerase sigma factor [Luteolibacter ambystomatis]QUE49483.1 sigma-70 family RNA polymerase sigma factor [Luteolibacter ambystomatis]